MERSFTGFFATVKDTHGTDPGLRRASVDHLEKVYGSTYVSSSAVTKTAMNESSGVAGGYTTPTDFVLQLMEVISESSFIYPRAQVIPFETAEVLVPKIDVETVPANPGTSPFFGGVVFTWGLEDAPAETEPAFRQMSLKAWDLLGYAAMSNQFLADTGPAGEEYLVKLFGKAAAWYAEYAFLQGLGAGNGMPMGLLNAPCAVTVNRAVANQIANTDIANMAAALLPHSWGSAIWAMSPTCLGQLAKIGNFFLNESVGRDEEREGAAGAILTRPYYVTEKLASLGTQGDLVLFDPGLYVVGIRQEVLIDMSTHNLFRTNQSVFRIWLRLDGKPQVSKPITLQDKATVVSPVVILKA
jgi:HK97 family phage major capsid protein